MVTRSHFFALAGSAAGPDGRTGGLAGAPTIAESPAFAGLRRGELGLDETSDALIKDQRGGCSTPRLLTQAHSDRVKCGKLCTQQVQGRRKGGGSAMKNTLALSTAAIAGALIATGTPQAKATVYDWSFSGASDSGSGTLTATGASSPFTMTAITGAFDGIAITGVAPPGTCCFAFPPFNDNLVFVPAPFLDTNGIAFITQDGSGVDIFFNGNGVPYGFRTSFPKFGNGTFTLTAIPEPSTWALMALGFAGLGLAGWRSRRRSVSIA
jgi:hypothetical protein